MSKVLRKLAAGETVIGSNDTIGSPRLLEVMGYAGLDMVVIDQMFCATDWETVASMVRAGRNYDLDTFVRLPAFPWFNRTDYRLAVDAARALGVGVTGLVFSVATVEEVEQLVEVSRSWHRDLHIHAFTEEEFATYTSRVSSQCVVMPLLESNIAFENMSKILAVPGLKTAWLGMTDLTRYLEAPFDYEHPAVARFVDRAVGLAEQYGVALAANLGYRFSRSPDDASRRAGRMVDQGVRIVMLQNNGYQIQWAYRNLLGQINSAIPPTHSMRKIAGKR